MPVAANRPAHLVERYAVFDEFAAGGMATVHLARLNGAHGFRRTVAVKRLLPHLTRDHDFALMLVDEARLAARIRHPNVVSTLDVVQTEHELLLVMDYVHGESLAKLARWAALRSERIPLPIACAIVADALHGLHAAHEATDDQGRPLGLVHRDVSPQNILVGLDGVTRIADFGVAKAKGRAQSTRDGVVKGKLAYMAPEQLHGGEVSRASDVFAAAVVLWEVLTGERLFAASTHAETVFKVMSANIAPPSARGAECPGLDDVVMRGLARDPGARFASAQEMALALETCAPSVRSSELARWVEHVVGDRLAQRAERLRAIERDDESHPAQSEARPREDVAPEEASWASGVQLQAMKGSRKRVAWALLAAGVVALAVGIAMTRKPVAAPRVHVVQTTEPTPKLPALAAEPPAVESPPVSPAVETPSVRKLRTGAASTRAIERAASRKANSEAKPSCDPPYRLDSAGHRLFKPECM